MAVLNTASGSCKPDSPDEAKAIFEAAGLSHAQVIAAAPPEITEALQLAVANADVLVVLGGDGTIRSAAARCGGAPTFLIPLPGGTMNMLPKALYGARTWQEALAHTLAAPVVHEVSGGVAEGQAFFVAALLGAPTLWADAREAVRLGKFVEAVKKAITAARRSLSDPLEYAFGGTVLGTAEAVAVVCPLISKVMAEDEPSLEAAALDPETAAEALRLGFHALFDDWRADPSVRRAKVKSLEAWGHGNVPVMLDGEKFRMGRRVAVHFVPLAFRALAPAPEASAA
ncbi:MAG: diacylglycerol/lipid kinase family protein [Caulobacteraceae bacterium]